jgi:aminoglycoside 6'-N-acetyltransferase
MSEFTFRRLERVDFPLLGRWLASPHVHRWWNHESSSEAVERDFGPGVDGEEPGEDWLALYAGRPFGLIQFSRFADYPEYVAEMQAVYPVSDGAGSIDYLIGAAADTGEGLGRAMVSAFVDRIWQARPDVTHLVVPVNSANVASWGALLSAGFRPVARGDLEPDNPIDGRVHEILRIDRP